MVLLEVPESVFATSPGYSKTDLLLDFSIWLYEKRRSRWDWPPRFAA